MPIRVLRRSGVAVGLLICLTIGLSAATVSETDENGDGEPDEWIITEDDGTTTVRKDRNFDGVADYELVYDEEAKKVREQLDFNHDGEMDDFYHYTDGVLRRREVDSDYDTRIDLWVFIVEGIYINRIERDLDADGEVDFVRDYGLDDEE